MSEKSSVDELPRPRVFIGSSSEARDKDITEILRVALSDVADVDAWHDSVFELGQSTLEGLMAAVDRYDFAVMAFTPDDLAKVRDQVSMIPRDNVLFELGLFMGRLGPDRTFILTNEKDRPKIPSDLNGITRASY